MRPILHTAVLSASACLLAVACSEVRSAGDKEEVPKSVDDVPAAVQVTAARLAERLGGSVGAWAWDTESEDWECAVNGLGRAVEMDIRSDGAFDEMEFVFTFDELEAALPDVAKIVSQQCRTEEGALIELSLRREALLVPEPRPAEVWSKSGVVIEFQCANGRDFELDARNMAIESKVDDRD